MATINERIKALRSTLGIKQVDFANKISRTQAVFSKYESGAIAITDRTIADICREFNVNEQWLRTGEGPMFRQQDNLDNMLTAEVAKLLRSSDDFTKKLVYQYLALPQDAKDKVKDFVTGLTKEE